MKLKVKKEEKRVVVLNQKDEVLSIWSNDWIEENGGLDKVLASYKKSHPKDEIEVIGDAAPAPAPAPEPAPAPAPEPAPAPAPEPAPAPAPEPAPGA